MATHELKSWSAEFQRMKKGEKCYELRKNDRNFQVGDELILLEFDYTTQNFTGDKLKATVKSIMESKNPFHDLDDYVIMSLEFKKGHLPYQPEKILNDLKEVLVVKESPDYSSIVVNLCGDIFIKRTTYPSEFIRKVISVTDKYEGATYMIYSDLNNTVNLIITSR